MTRGLALLLCSACTLDSGTGFATLSEASVEARLGGDAAVTTDLGYRLTFTRFELDVDHVVLEGVAAVARESDGHAHGDEESETEEALGHVSIAEVHVEAPVDVLAGETVVSEEVEPSSELPLATIEEVSVQITAVRIEATVEGEAPIAIDVPVAAALGGGTELSIDRDGPRTIDLSVRISVGNDLFDGIDLASVSPDPDAIARRVIESEVSVTVGGEP